MVHYFPTALSLDLFRDLYPLPDPSFCEIFLYPYDPFSYFVEVSPGGYLLFATKKSLNQNKLLSQLGFPAPFAKGRGVWIILLRNSIAQNRHGCFLLRG